MIKSKTQKTYFKPTAKNVVGAILVLTIVLTTVFTSAAELLAPEDYKPTRVLGLNKSYTESSDPSSAPSQAEQEEDQADISITDEDQKIISQLEKELNISIPKVEIKQDTAKKSEYTQDNGYALNSQGRVSHLILSKNKKFEPHLIHLKKFEVKNKHLTLIGKLTGLQELDLGGNQITKIEGLDSLTSLQKLDLGGNQITKIEKLDSLTSLQELWLDWNNITKIEGLDKLASLQDLRLGWNNITIIQGLDSLTSLQDLRLDSNQIAKTEGLDSLS
ncbi:MAG: protein phosphatase 1 regulatory subunit 42, partial [Saprospiraceae bacterium]|nr:protein phosphatase 1 regulatory subunit 42 [Saprospiraceae bacterium]